MVREAQPLKEKVMYRNDKIPCPHCGKLLDIKLLRETLIPTVKGSYKRKLVVEASNQKTL